MQDNLFLMGNSYIHFCSSGVADGVGGWRRYGIDPGEFSSFLMRTCDRLVTSGRFCSTEPASLLARSYYELLENKQPILGKCSLIIFFVLLQTDRKQYNIFAKEEGLA